MPRILTLLLLLLSPGLWAQQEADEPTPAADEAAEETAAAAEETRPAATDESPFDYQSSEKISEDLSVSFPVDI